MNGHRLSLETRTELKKKRELKRMKDTGNTAIDEPEPEVKSNLATPQDMMNVQNDLGVLQHEIVRMREEEKKWMAHY